MKLEIELPFSEEEMSHAQAESERGNAGPLRSLCQKEVARFESVMKEHPDYRDGLVKIERYAVEGYLYQKLRGHLNEKTEVNHLPSEG